MMNDYKLTLELPITGRKIQFNVQAEYEADADDLAKEIANLLPSEEENNDWVEGEETVKLVWTGKAERVPAPPTPPIPVPEVTVSYWPLDQQYHVKFFGMSLVVDHFENGPYCIINHKTIALLPTAVYDAIKAKYQEEYPRLFREA